MEGNVVTPQNVSLEDAYRYLASAVTGTPFADVPQSQEGAIMCMANYINSQKAAKDTKKTTNRAASKTTN